MIFNWFYRYFDFNFHFSASLCLSVDRSVCLSVILYNVIIWVFIHLEFDDKYFIIDKII